MNEIERLEKIREKVDQLNQLRKRTEPTPVKNYQFDVLGGKTSLLDLFAGRTTLFAIHNMGQGCRYCTLWADGFNAFVPHLESQFAVDPLSKDPPECSGPSPTVAVGGSAWLRTAAATTSVSRTSCLENQTHPAWLPIRGRGINLQAEFRPLRTGRSVLSVVARPEPGRH